MWYKFFKTHSLPLLYLLSSCLHSRDYFLSRPSIISPDFFPSSLRFVHACFFSSGQGRNCSCSRSFGKRRRMQRRNLRAFLRAKPLRESNPELREDGAFSLHKNFQRISSSPFLYSIPLQLHRILRFS